MQQSLEEGEEPVRHHLGEEGNVLRGVLLRPVVGRVLLSNQTHVDAEPQELFQIRHVEVVRLPVLQS